MKTKDIEQEVFINAAPSDIYHAFMDSEIHSKFTGDNATIGTKNGEEFSAFDGYATGKNLELKENKLIKQTWRASDWPENHYSTIEITLQPQDNGTLLKFKQTGIPEYNCDDISEGWYAYYWNPLQQMFKK